MILEKDYGLFSPELIENASDHAVYLWERLRSTGTQLEIEEYERMLERIEPGTQHFDGFTEDVVVLDSQVFMCRENYVGMREFRARVHLLGNHHENGIGIRLPHELALNNRGQDESIAYAIVSSNHARPGKTRAIIPPIHSLLYNEADRVYHDFHKNLTGFENVLYVLWNVGELRANRSQPVPFERNNTIFDATTTISTAAAD